MWDPSVLPRCQACHCSQFQLCSRIALISSGTFCPPPISLVYSFNLYLFPFGSAAIWNSFGRRWLSTERSGYTMPPERIDLLEYGWRVFRCNIPTGKCSFHLMFFASWLCTCTTCPRSAAVIKLQVRAIQLYNALASTAMGENYTFPWDTRYPPMNHEKPEAVVPQVVGFHPQELTRSPVIPDVDYAGPPSINEAENVEGPKDRRGENVW